MRLIVTVDTEADNQWRRGMPLTTGNIAYWRPFQDLCERHGIPPVYLITTEIASDPKASDFLAPLVESGKIEVGAHLHPWTTPPFHDRDGLRENDSIHTFPSDLEPELFRLKMLTLTERIANAVGKHPTSYRAGRFGFQHACANTLSRLGYTVDSSVTPYISWRRNRDVQNGGWPDFSSHSPLPCQLPTDGSPFFEIPVTITHTSPLLRVYPKLTSLYNLGAAVVRRLPGFGNPPEQPLWLRPFPGMRLQHLIRVWDQVKHRGAPFAVMMFHSSELMPGGSPFRQTTGSVRDLLDLLRDFFHFVRQNGADAITLCRAGKMLEQNPPGFAAGS